MCYNKFMKKIVLTLSILFLTFCPMLNVKAEDSFYSKDYSGVFELDIKTLKYEQKQLVYAIITGNEKAVRTILNSDPEPKTTYAKIPLTMFAIHSNEVDILKMLIEDYNFDPNETIMNVTPLELAIATKKYDSIRYLLSIGVSPSEEALKLLEKRKYKKVKEIFDEYINTKEN